MNGLTVLALVPACWILVSKEYMNALIMRYRKMQGLGLLASQACRTF